MTLFVWFLLLLLAGFIVLGAILVVTFVRLSRELKQLGDDAGMMIAKTEHSIRTVQMIIPVVALIKRGAQLARTKYRDIRTKEDKNGSKNRKR